MSGLRRLEREVIKNRSKKKHGNNKSFNHDWDVYRTDKELRMQFERDGRINPKEIIKKDRRNKKKPYTNKKKTGVVNKGVNFLKNKMKKLISKTQDK